MKTVQFKNIAVGDFFKEQNCNVWQMKTSSTTALYHSNGITGEPRFNPEESVLVEA
tara:strand:- start:10395 stop:10562 length:168 start_codon:yes stop_codon:yes gene_type:complete